MSDREKTVVVFGGAGYIGWHVVNQLLVAGQHCTIVDTSDENCWEDNPNVDYYRVWVKDLEEYRLRLSEIASTYDVIGVINLAGATRNDNVNNPPNQYYSNNLATNIMILEWMLENNLNNLVFASSASVYSSAPTRKEFITECDPLVPRSAYSITKLMTEMMLVDYKQMGIKSLTLRYFNVVGCDENYNSTGLYKKESLSSRALRQVLDPKDLNDTLMLCGYPKDINQYTPPVLDFVDVRDTAAATVTALQHLIDTPNVNHLFHSVMNVGTERGTSLTRLLDIYSKAAGQEIKYTFRNAYKYETPRCVSNCNLIRNKLGFQSTYTVEESAKSMVDYMKRITNDII